MKEAAEFYKKNGYVMFQSFAKTSETVKLRERAAEIMEDFYKKKSANKRSSTSVFTTVDDIEKMDTEYFLRSASNISCFLEERQQSESGDRPAINKIGHALHDLDPVFGKFSRAPEVRAVADALSVEDPMVVQSMYILKGARTGGEVRAHRDGNYVRAKKGTCTAMWWALMKADEENGCIWAVPGSHLHEGSRRSFILDESKEKTMYGGDPNADMYDDAEFVPLTADEGDLLIINGGVVHKSEDNHSDRNRQAYAITLVSGELEDRCWIQRPESFPFRSL